MIATMPSPKWTATGERAERVERGLSKVANAKVGKLTTGELVYAYGGDAYLFSKGNRVAVIDWFVFCGLVRRAILSWR